MLRVFLAAIILALETRAEEIGIEILLRALESTDELLRFEGPLPEYARPIPYANFPLSAQAAAAISPWESNLLEAPPDLVRNALIAEQSRL